ncbi:MAG: hypothetical protein V3U26_04295 [Dehalococcoidia bacterium]
MSPETKGGFILVGNQSDNNGSGLRLRLDTSWWPHPVLFTVAVALLIAITTAIANYELTDLDVFLVRDTIFEPPPDSDIGLTYQGRSVEALRLIELEVVNTGTKAIAADDFESLSESNEGLELLFIGEADSKEIEGLFGKIVSTSPETMNVRLTQTGPRKYAISKTLLNQGNRIELQFIFRSDSPVNVTATARIRNLASDNVDVRDVARRVTFDDAGRPKEVTGTKRSSKKSIFAGSFGMIGITLFFLTAPAIFFGVQGSTIATKRSHRALVNALWTFQFLMLAGAIIQLGVYLRGIEWDVLTIPLGVIAIVLSAVTFGLIWGALSQLFEK